MPNQPPLRFGGIRWSSRTFYVDPEIGKLETARTIDREIQQRIALKSMQRLRRDVSNVSTRFLILWRNRSFMRERITASQLR